jgi:hypothetical protein
MAGLNDTPDARFLLRFWGKVNLNGPVHPVLGTRCWIWTASKKRNGYGQFGIKKGVIVLSHRFAWELIVGPIPEKLYVLHRCDNPPCINVAHLFVGTQADNISDAFSKGRRGKIDCGHQIIGDNVYWKLQKGVRVPACRTCKRARERRSYYHRMIIQ